LNKFIPRIDWRATYRRFSELHGGNPLEWKGWLLFPDGWRWSATSYQGPEAAPENELEAKKLTTIYYRMRLVSVRREWRDLRVVLGQLEQSMRSMSDHDGVSPLQMRIVGEKVGRNKWGDEITLRVPASCDLDLDRLRGRVQWLADDAALCERAINELSDANLPDERANNVTTARAGH
jgi:hypothetical protein